MTSPLTRTRLALCLLALLGLLLAPLSIVLSAAPASAVDFIAHGSVADALGDPVAGATITAYDAPAGNVQAATTQTDAGGVYDLDLGEGSYKLHVEKAGFTPTWYGGDVPRTLDVDDTGQISVGGEPVADNELGQVELASTVAHDVGGLVKASGGAGLSGIVATAHLAGDPATDVDTATTVAGGGYTLQLPLGTYELEFGDPAGVYLPTWYGGPEPGLQVTVQADGGVLVGGLPTSCASLCDVTLDAAPVDAEYPIAGDVVDANGNPVNGIEVTVTPVAPSSDSGNGTTATVGGEAGRYSVSVLPGTYRVGFSGTGFVSAPYTGQGGSGQATVTVANNGTLSVAPAEDLTSNRLNPTVLTSIGYAVGGTVVTSAAPAQPIAGITVAAFPTGDASTPVDDAATNGSGVYSLTLPIGTYDLQYVDEVLAAPDYLLTWLGGATPEPFQVGQGGVLTYLGTTVTGVPDVAMAEPAPDATYDLSGAVTDDLGDAIDGLVVTATASGATPAGQTTSDTTGVDPDSLEHGVYHLLVEAGTYLVSLEGGAHFADATYPGAGASALTITVQPNGVIRAGAAEVPGGVLDPVALAGTTTYPLAGRATDGSVGLSGLSVKVYPEGDTTGEPLASVTTRVGGGGATVGSFTVPLPIGSYVMQLSGSSGGTLYSQRWYGTGPTGTPVQVRQGGALSEAGSPVVALDDAVMSVADATTTYALTGEVVDANYEPIAGVLVTAVAIFGGAQTDTDTSDADGGFQLDVRPGTYEVSYAKAGYATSFYLDPEGELGTERARVVVDLDGTMRIHDTALSGGLLDSQVLVGTATHAVSGTVVDEAAVGLSGITVQALPDGGTTAVATTTTAAGGGYSLQLPVGTYHLRFTDNLLAAPTYAVTYLGGDVPQVLKVATGGQLSVDDVEVTAPLAAVTMTEVASDVAYDLKGFVYDEQYEYFDGVLVEALPVSGTPAGNAATGTTGPDADDPGSLGDAGVYRVPVHPGKYRLRFSATGHQTTYLASFEDLTKPVTVTVAANGVITAPGLEIAGGVIDDVQLLLTAPTMLTAPRLSGKVVVGQTVVTSLGTWSPLVTVEEGYSYVSWFLDGKPADATSSGRYYERLKLTPTAATKKLTYRVVLEDPDGLRAPAVFTSAAVVVPKAPSTIAGTYRAGEVKVTVKVPGLKKPLGKIKVLDGKTKLGKATLVAKNKGIVVITLAALSRGKHKLTLVYAGTSTVAGSKKVLKVTV